VQGRDRSGISPARRRVALIRHGEKDGANAGACGVESVGRQRLPGAAVLFHDGSELGALAWSVGAKGDEAAARCETAERMGDVLDIVAVCKRRIYHNTLELAQTEALQKVIRQHAPTKARGFVFLGRDRLREQMRE